jgi:hypothetical protein
MSAEHLHQHGHEHDHGHGHDRDGHAHAPHAGHGSHAHTPVPTSPAEAADLRHGQPSLLMRGAGARVAAALAMVGVLWLAVVWALMEHAP